MVRAQTTPIDTKSTHRHSSSILTKCLSVVPLLSSQVFAYRELKTDDPSTLLDRMLASQCTRYAPHGIDLLMCCCDISVSCSRVSTGVSGPLKRWCAVMPYVALCIHWDTCTAHALIFPPHHCCTLLGYYLLISRFIFYFSFVPISFPPLLFIILFFTNSVRAQCSI
jgi:hypothetical protein